MKSSTHRWIALITCNIVAWSMLSFFGTTGAAPRQPFSNAVEQRQQMIRELTDIKALLKEQNALLRAADEKEDSNNERRQR